MSWLLIVTNSTARRKRTSDRARTRDYALSRSFSHASHRSQSRASIPNRPYVLVMGVPPSSGRLRPLWLAAIKAFINCTQTACIQLIRPSRSKCPVTLNDCFLLGFSLKVHQAYFIVHIAMSLYDILLLLRCAICSSDFVSDPLIEFVLLHLESN